MTSRFDQAAASFARIHEEDPRAAGGTSPSAVYHRRVAAWVERLDPEASEALRLAARCQHIRRWSIPRGDYPAGRRGYKRWRTELGRKHACEAAAVLRAHGYDDGTIERVEALLTKKDLAGDPEARLLEDAVCLVFLEHELEAFAAKHPADKVVDILQKTWRKMSPRGHRHALELSPGMGEAARRLVEKATGA